MKMANRKAFLPFLLVISFPVLYWGGHLENAAISGLGLVLMVGGVATPALSRIARRSGKTQK